MYGNFIIWWKRQSQTAGGMAESTLWEKDNYAYDKLSIYWDDFEDEISADEKVDEITWNDLEMNHVYARINSCVSYAGDQVLYGRLHHLEQNQQKLERREERIWYFQEHDKERAHMQEILCRIGKEESSYYLPRFMKNVDVIGLPYMFLYRLLQLLLIAFLLVTFFTGSSVAGLIALTVYACNVMLYVVKKNQFQIYIDSLGGIIRLIKSAKLVMQDKNFSEEVPANIKNDMVQFHKLEHMIGMLQKSQEASITGDIVAMLREYVIGGTLLDFTNFDYIVRKLRGKQKEFMEIYEYVGELDMAIALGSFRKSLPHYCLPEFTDEKCITMDEIYHPLLDVPICNNAVLDKNCIITGSNASGKSTFIKAIAVNAILAQSIHTCMAKSMQLPRARIITSMAIRDDLMSGESYYMKEIKYLNRIVQSLSEDKMVICVIDEILRGTNTQERIAASAAVLKYLLGKNCLAIVASHDIELIDLLGKAYEYYYFCEQIGADTDDIVFDYKMHHGVGNTKNAIRLLEYVGFPQEIIAEAKEICINY